LCTGDGTIASEDTAMRSPRRNISIILSVFIVSLIVRLDVLLQFRNTVYFGNPIMDAALYHDAAADFLSRGQFGASLFLMSPLYQVFLSAVYSLIGIDLPGVYIIQIFIGSVSAVLLYIIAAKMFGRTAALVASGLYLLY
jgi:4-amino-4-deoxy-L-arabinose transferase-like glycosyltransferase